MNSKFPKISIVTPSYDQVEFLENAILSVVSQDYENIEYIVIDGGSEDGSQDVIKRYANRIKYWCSESDNGQYDAIDKGFQKSTGEIMAWLNSDDMYYAWTFKTVACIMARFPEVEWLTTLMPGYWDRYGFCLGLRSTTGYTGYSKAAFLDGCYLTGMSPGRNLGWIQQESTFWRRSLWQRSGARLCDRDIAFAGDFELWSRFYKYGELVGVEVPLAGFRIRDQQRGSCEQYRIEAKQILLDMRREWEWIHKSKERYVKRKKLQRTMPFLFRCFRSDNENYRGRKIVRKNPGSTDADWDLVEYEFN